MRWEDGMKMGRFPFPPIFPFFAEICGMFAVVLKKIGKIGNKKKIALCTCGHKPTSDSKFWGAIKAPL